MTHSLSEPGSQSSSREVPAGVSFVRRCRNMVSAAGCIAFGILLFLWVETEVERQQRILHAIRDGLENLTVQLSENPLQADLQAEKFAEQFRVREADLSEVLATLKRIQQKASEQGLKHSQGIPDNVREAGKPDQKINLQRLDELMQDARLKEECWRTAMRTQYETRARRA